MRVRAPAGRQVALVTVYIPNAFRRFSAGREQVELSSGGSLRRVFEALDAECPGIKDQLMFEGSIVHPGLAVFVNDEQITQGLIEQIPEDATIRILPAMGGGAPNKPAWRAPPGVRLST